MRTGPTISRTGGTGKEFKDNRQAASTIAAGGRSAYATMSVILIMYIVVCTPTHHYSASSHPRLYGIWTRGSRRAGK